LASGQSFSIAVENLPQLIEVSFGGGDRPGLVPGKSLPKRFVQRDDLGGLGMAGLFEGLALFAFESTQHEIGNGSEDVDDDDDLKDGSEEVVEHVLPRSGADSNTRSVYIIGKFLRKNVIYITKSQVFCKK